MEWRDGKETALVITVNMHGEFGALSYYPDMKLVGSEQEEVAESVMYSGTIRILDLLDAVGIKGTFFVPGIAAVKYRELMNKVLERGHEIGIQGYSHRNMGLMTEEEQREDIRKSRETVKRLFSVEPVGFRAADGELTLRTLEIAKEEGIKYSSTLQNYDVPYWNCINRKKETLLELPIFWSLNDAPYFQYYFDPPIPYSQSRISSVHGVLDNWMREWRMCVRNHGCLILQIDPIISGETSKLIMLEEFLRNVIHDDVWFTTGKELYEYAAEHRENFHTLDCFLTQYMKK